MKNVIVDLDGTITVESKTVDYSNVQPNTQLIEKLKSYKALGYTIIIHTARGMRSHNGDIQKITVHNLPIIIDWLNKHSVPYDEIIIGKPWCGTEGFYIDNKAIRPSEFITYDENTIKKLLE